MMTPKKVFSHYKELETMGLAAPQITYIMHALKEHGLNVDADATTVEEARDSILAALAQAADSPLLNRRRSGKMIRDITIGQYYPAKSVLHRLDPTDQISGNSGISDLRVPVPYISRICGGNGISGSHDRNIQGSGEIHVQGSEGHRDDPSDHGCVQYHPDAWRSAVAFRDHQGHKGRPCSCRKNGDPSCLPCDRIFHHDTDYHAESADRRSGETAPSAEQDPGAGT